jgi:hypothetical protein
MKTKEIFIAVTVPDDYELHQDKNSICINNYTDAQEDIEIEGWRVIEQPAQVVPDAVLDDDVIRITIAEEFGIENGELGVWPDVRGLMKFARKIAMQTTPPQSDAREVERERLALENAMRVVALTERVAELEAMLGRWLPFGRADADGEIARFIVADTEAMLNAAPSAPMGMCDE